MLSCSSKPVKGFALRLALEAPRYARISRARYIAWSENRFVLIRTATRLPTSARNAATATTRGSDDEIVTRTCIGVSALGASASGAREVADSDVGGFVSHAGH